MTIISIMRTYLANWTNISTVHTHLKWRYKPTSLVSGYKNSMRSKITTHHSIPPLDLCFSDLFAHIVFFRGEVKYYLRYCRQKWIFLIFGAKALGEVVFLVIVSDRWIMWFANLKIRNNWDATEFSHRMFNLEWAVSNLESNLKILN